ncbi:MAG TPA: D-glycero-beta-D-manno-heptose 1-phosphate adenylyltransferase [Rubrobacteraceae bacterium]|nr:D-glycero-beta-D-manno-heptose 1-phosphate adenylyltransferase [Rubrobacteraceae bacterium]
MAPDRSAYGIPSRIIRVREAGGSVVFTNGCFDLLHPGHVSYLRAARDLGDALVVGLNSDASVGKLKGASRPIVPEGDRATVLAALESVDAVIVFGEDTPIRLLRELKPAVYVKGGDYRIEDLPEAEVAAEIGAEIKILPFEPRYSTTALIEKIRNIPRTTGASHPG